MQLPFTLAQCSVFLVIGPRRTAAVNGEYDLTDLTGDLFEARLAKLSLLFKSDAVFQFGERFLFKFFFLMRIARAYATSVFLWPQFVFMKFCHDFDTCERWKKE